MRISVKEKRKPKLAEYSFIVPEFKLQGESVNANLASLGVAPALVDTTGTLQYVQNQMAERRLAFNQFVSVKDQLNVDITLENASRVVAEGQGKVIEPVCANGFDGFGGAHDNLIYNPADGMMTYTLHNKIIQESSRTRLQTIITESEVRLSCLAISPNKRLLAAAEGEPNNNLGKAQIFLIDLTDNNKVRKIPFFEHGVQAMAFSICGKFLIAASVAAESVMVIVDIASGMVVEGGTIMLREKSVNKITVNQHTEGSDVDFCTVGQ